MRKKRRSSVSIPANQSASFRPAVLVASSDAKRSQYLLISLLHLDIKVSNWTSSKDAAVSIPANQPASFGLTLEIYGDSDRAVSIPANQSALFGHTLLSGSNATPTSQYLLISLLHLDIYRGLSFI